MTGMTTTRSGPGWHKDRLLFVVIPERGEDPFHGGQGIEGKLGCGRIALGLFLN